MRAFGRSIGSADTATIICHAFTTMVAAMASVRAIRWTPTPWLPVLTRVILQLHQRHDLSYAEIARRLSIDMDAVMACVAEALAMIAAMLDGEEPHRWRAARITPAETALHQRHRLYCEDRLRTLVVAPLIIWGKVKAAPQPNGTKTIHPGKRGLLNEWKSGPEPFEAWLRNLCQHSAPSVHGA